MDDAAWERVRTLGLPPIVPCFASYPLDAQGRLPRPVEAGRWVGVLRPGEGAQLAYARPTVVELDLAPGTKARQRVEIAQGGRLRIAAVEPVPGASALRVTLEREDGTSVDLALTTLQLRRDARAGRTTATGRMPFGVAAESALLDPGAYVLRAEAGGRSAVASVEIPAGATREVTLALR
jgi:hypothetical protein